MNKHFQFKTLTCYLTYKAFSALTWAQLFINYFCSFFFTFYHKHKHKHDFPLVDFEPPHAKSNRMRKKRSNSESSGVNDRTSSLTLKRNRYIYIMPGYLNNLLVMNE